LKLRLSRSEPLRTLSGNLPFYTEHGMNVEIRLTDAEYNREVAVKDLEDLARRLKEKSISAFCHLPFHGLHLSCPDPRVMTYSREVIQEGLEIGTILGCKAAILHSGFSNHVQPVQTQAWKERLIGSLRELVQQAEEEEIVLAIENAYEPDGALLLEVLEAIDSPWLRFCVDLGHAACFSRMAPEEWIVTFKDHLISLHMHDNEGMEDEHLACGRGVVGYDVVYQTLKEVDANCNVILEVADEDIAPSLEHLKSVGFAFEKGEIPDSEILPSMMNGVE
jgi:sugar phosphate isomerase/epimerase